MQGRIFSTPTHVDERGTGRGGKYPARCQFPEIGVPDGQPEAGSVVTGPPPSEMNRTSLFGNANSMPCSRNA